MSIAVVGSTGAVGALLALERFSRSSIHFTVWLAAASAFVTDCDGALCRSLCTVVNADSAVDKLPELIALPSAAISVESWEVGAELLALERALLVQVEGAGE